MIAESSAPDVVINNAGQMYVGITEAFSEDELAAQLDVNVVGVHRVHRAFLPAMRARGAGLFINISSIAGRMGVPFHGVYHASKWGLEGYSRGSTYPPVVHETLTAMGAMFDALFNDSAVPTDPDLVVDRLVELVEMAPGTRPFRSVVGVDFDIRARNAAVETFDTALLEAAGLTSFTTLVTPVVASAPPGA